MDKYHKAEAAALSRLMRELLRGMNFYIDLELISIMMIQMLKRIQAVLLLTLFMP